MGFLVVVAVAVGGGSIGCDSSIAKGTLRTDAAVGAGGVTGTGGATGGRGAAGSGGATGTGGVRWDGAVLETGGAFSSGGTGTGGIGLDGARDSGPMICLGGMCIDANTTNTPVSTGGWNSDDAGFDLASDSDAGECGDDLGSSDPGAIDASLTDGQPPTCGQIKTEAECELRNDCHAVFVRLGECPTTGDCMRFGFCAYGGRADCIGPSNCRLIPPICEPPLVRSYIDLCNEGCVRQTSCGAPSCPQIAPANATSCGPIGYTCHYEDCAGVGHTKAVCSDEKWTVEVAACSPTECDSWGSANPRISRTCAAGEICSLVSDYDTATPNTDSACWQNSCGTGPISLKCFPKYPAVCYLQFSSSSTVVRCEIVH